MHLKYKSCQISVHPGVGLGVFFMPVNIFAICSAVQLKQKWKYGSIGGRRKGDVNERRNHAVRYF